MEFRETLPQTIGELQRTKQDGAGARQSVRQQIPAEWMIVLPCQVIPMDQEAFVVYQDITDHQADKAKQKIFETNARRSLNRDSGGGHLTP